MEGNIRLREIRRQFAGVFAGDRRSVSVFRAPGRVNLIGEHTDYNEGFVLPVAVDREIWIAARPRDDDKVRIHSVDLRSAAQFSLSGLSTAPKEHWLGYPMGVAAMLQRAGHRLRGMDALVASPPRARIPIGSGMSSSAAFEVATALAFTHLSGVDAGGLDLVRLCQKAENEYVGVSCGIMDQFVSFFARSDHALFLDCRSLQHDYAPLPAGHSIVVCDSGVRRGLVSSQYNVRRSECEEGAKLLKEFLPAISSLRDVSPSEFEAHKGSLPATLRQRCEHVIYETSRVLRVVEALSAGSLIEVGELLNASHASLRDLYEVSCRELDVLVELAVRQEGTLGSRLTGAGFGGCTVSLVLEEAVEAFRAEVAEGYRARTGRETAVYVCRAVDGGGRVLEAAGERD